jgi:hypothetical protein
MAAGFLIRGAAGPLGEGFPTELPGTVRPESERHMPLAYGIGSGMAVGRCEFRESE